MRINGTQIAAEDVMETVLLCLIVFVLPTVIAAIRNSPKVKRILGVSAATAIPTLVLLACDYSAANARKIQIEAAKLGMETTTYQERVLRMSPQTVSSPGELESATMLSPSPVVFLGFLAISILGWVTCFNWSVLPDDKPANGSSPAREVAPYYPPFVAKPDSAPPVAIPAPPVQRKPATRR
jgi:hypothetical protein